MGNVSDIHAVPSPSPSPATTACYYFMRLHLFFAWKGKVSYVLCDSLFFLGSTLQLTSHPSLSRVASFSFSFFSSPPSPSPMNRVTLLQLHSLSSFFDLLHSVECAIECSFLLFPSDLCTLVLELTSWSSRDCPMAPFDLASFSLTLLTFLSLSLSHRLPSFDPLSRLTMDTWHTPCGPDRLIDSSLLSLSLSLSLSLAHSHLLNATTRTNCSDRIRTSINVLGDAYGAGK